MCMCVCVPMMKAQNGIQTKILRLVWRIPSKIPKLIHSRPVQMFHNYVQNADVLLVQLCTSIPGTRERRDAQEHGTKSDFLQDVHLCKMYTAHNLDFCLGNVARDFGWFTHCEMCANPGHRFT